MGYRLTLENMNKLIVQLQKNSEVYAPKVFEGEGTFSDTDRIRYGKINKIEEIEFDKKSDFSYKEVLLPITQVLFFFTEDKVKEAEVEEKNLVVFLRSCDLHGVKRIDDIYLRNGFVDPYYKKIREKTKFIVFGCEKSFENCFCVDMGTNKTDEYDCYIKVDGNEVLLDVKDKEIEELVKIFEKSFENCFCVDMGTNKTDEYDCYIKVDGNEVLLDVKDKEIEELVKIFAKEDINVIPEFVEKNEVKVNIPENLDLSVMDSKMWDEYSQRCIACGRCNFVCPTCTCFTMQDVIYRDNGKVGERRRVWASCQVDGYTDMAGGHSFRRAKGERMRYKVLHKVYDYKKKWGYHMCVGCGRCDDICPEYISFSNCINKLEKAMDEVK